MDSMSKILLLLFLVEAISENIKWLINKQWDADRIIAFVVSIAVSLLAGLDIFEFVGWPLMIPYVGSLLTGIVFARGSNIVHDLWKLIPQGS